MRYFQIRCANARAVGAIGVFYGVYERIEASNEWEAELKFRELYETKSPPDIKEELQVCS